MGQTFCKNQEEFSLTLNFINHATKQKYAQAIVSEVERMNGLAVALLES